MMFNNYIWTILIGLLFYKWLPTSENNLLVLLEVNKDSVNKLSQIQNVKAAFEIDTNIDEHMGTKDDKKANWNYVLLTTHMKNEKEALEFSKKLEKMKFIKDVSTFPFTSNPFKAKLLNGMLSVKSVLGHIIPSLQATFTADTSGDSSGLLKKLCNQNKMKEEGPRIMVNIMKVKDSEEMGKYTDAVAMKMFPYIGSFIFEMGVPQSDYWDTIALVQYKDRAGFCTMATAKEYRNVVIHKQKGLADTHTYLTKQII